MGFDIALVLFSFFFFSYGMEARLMEELKKNEGEVERCKRDGMGYVTSIVMSTCMLQKRNQRCRIRRILSLLLFFLLTSIRGVFLLDEWIGSFFVIVMRMGWDCDGEECWRNNAGEGGEGGEMGDAVSGDYEIHP